MNNEIKLLMDFGLVRYDELLKAHGLRLIEENKPKSMSITYNDATRILKFSYGTTTDTKISFIDDGYGNVFISSLPSSSILSNDEFGNVTLTNVVCVDDGNGKVNVN